MCGIDVPVRFKTETSTNGNFAGVFALLISLLFAVPGFSAETNRQTIVVLGDSIAAGYGVELSESFPSLLQARIDEKKLPYQIVNAGVSGDTTASGVRRMPWLMKREIDVLVIELGGNDGLRGITPTETESNLEKIIDLARGKYPDVQIVIAGMQMPQNMGAKYTDAFQKIFPKVAREKKTALVPFLLEGVGGKAEMNQPDRIHPNPQGHKIVADNVWAVLEPLLNADSGA
jgi:acyl-CoA thioesterase-1